MLLTFLTYNVHSCLSARKEPSLELVARAIRSCSPDVVALQELDAGCDRTDGIHQAEHLASATGMNAIFKPLVSLHGGEYGFGFLVKKSINVLDESVELLPKRHPSNEQRGLLTLTLEIKGHTFACMNTHLSTSQRERKYQVPVVMEIIQRKLSMGQNVVFMGDLNAIRGAETIRTFGKLLRPCRPGLLSPGTFPSKYPLLQLDHIFCSKSLMNVSSRVITTTVCREASDHLPLMSKIEFESLT